MIKLIVAKQSLPTGRILAEALRERGVKLSETPSAVVSYGVPLNTERPSLNAKAGATDKLEQLRILQKSGLPTPTFYVGSVPTNAKFPLLARKRNHRAGKDIMPVFHPSEVEWRKAAGAQFFSEYIAPAGEIRVWIYRGRHLATYAKQMRRPEEYKRIGWNYTNGFAFSLVKSEDVNRGAADVAAKCVDALGLDFAAVDVLLDHSGKFYILEANTAPGVEGIGRQGLQGLADKIARWEQLGYPSRKAGTG